MSGWSRPGLPLGLRDPLPWCQGAAGLGPRRAAALGDGSAEVLLPVSTIGGKTENWEEVQGFHMRKSLDFQEIPHITSSSSSSSSSSWLLLFTVDESSEV